MPLFPQGDRRQTSSPLKCFAIDISKRDQLFHGGIIFQYISSGNNATNIPNFIFWFIEQFNQGIDIELIEKRQ